LPFLVAFALTSLLGWAPGALAGIDAWTTTGPRAGWPAIFADTRVGGASFVGTWSRWARSDDLASHWAMQPLPEGTDANWVYSPSFAFRIDAMCADASTPGRLYAALGGDEGTKLHRSDDDGRTWTLLPGNVGATVLIGGGTPTGVTVRRLECDGAMLYALVSDATTTPLARSADGAATPFQKIAPPGYVSDFAVDGQHVVAVGQAAAQWSADGGATWTPGFVLPAGKEFASVAFSANRVVALVRGPFDGETNPYEIWTSDDFGATFAPQPTGAFQSALGAKLRIDPLRPTHWLVYALDRLRASVDGGATWVDPGAPAPRRGPLSATWAAPLGEDRPSILVATRDDGVLMSGDLGVTFVPQNRGLPGAPTEHLGATSFQGERFLLASDGVAWITHDFWDPTGGALSRRGGSANLWERRTQTPTSIKHPFSVVPGFPGAVEDFGTGVRSDDAGATWMPSTLGGASVIDVAHATDGVPGTLAASGSTRAGIRSVIAYGSSVLVEPDGLTPRDLGLGFGNQTNVLALAVAPSDIQVLYVAHAGGMLGGPATTFLRSATRAASWQARTLPPGPAGKIIHRIVVDPADANQVLVTFYESNVVLLSVDGAVAWAPIAPPPSATVVFTLVYDRGTTPARLYAATDDGVFVLEGSPVWARVGDSAGWRVANLRVDGPVDRRTLTASTDRGVFEMTMDSAAATLPVFRFYNVDTQTHFYTASAAERDHVIATYPQFHPEGVAFHAVAADRAGIGTPVWRFFNTSTGTHFYTASADERAHVLATWPQFVDEGVAYRALTGTEPGTVKLFRFFNAATGAHFYTTEDDERAVVNQHLPTYADEGVVFAVFPAVPAP